MVLYGKIPALFGLVSSKKKKKLRCKSITSSGGDADNDLVFSPVRFFSFEARSPGLFVRPPVALGPRVD